MHLSALHPRHWPAGLRVGLSLLFAIVLVAASADLIRAGNPLDMVAAPSQWPGSDPAHPLGTDLLGRDILAGVVHGARTSLLIGLACALLAALLGIALGVVSGYLRGGADRVVLRLVEFFQIMPSLLFTVTLVAIVGPSTGTIVFGIVITNWPSVARIVRAEVLRVRESEYVQASRVVGLGDLALVLRHVLPNVVTPAIALVSVLAGSAILSESTLSFLGLGDPNVATWGGMIDEGRKALFSAWYMSAIPGAAIATTVVALGLVGNGLNDALNPRRGQGL